MPLSADARLTSASSDGHPVAGEANPSAEVSKGVQPAAMAVLTAGLLVLCVVLAIPVLPALTWGAALAVVAWPLHDRLCRRLGRPGLAAFFSTVLVVVLIAGPALAVLFQAAREVSAAAEPFSGEVPDGSLHEWLAETPALGRVVRWLDRAGIDLDEQARETATGIASAAADFAAGSARSVGQALIAVVVLFFLLRDRSAFAGGLRGLLPMSDAEADQVTQRAGDAVHANLYANLVTSVIDAAGAGLVFWAVGLPAPLLVAAITFVVTLLPLVGSAGVWVPAAAYLALTGRWLPAVVVAIWGVATFALVDHLLYVRLVGGRLRLHPLPLLVAILGGLAVFGVSGLILGPTILAVTDSLLDCWRQRNAARRTA